MGRINEWFESNFIKEPQKPKEESIDSIISMTYAEIKEKTLEEIESYIFILSSFSFYISHQYAILESRYKAKENIIKNQIVHMSQKYKLDTYEERLDMARVNNQELRDKSEELYFDYAQMINIKELKFSIKDKIEAIKMIFWNKKGIKNV